MLTYETAEKLKSAGFPHITRWEIENNYVRQIMVGGESLPPLGALISEIPRTIIRGKTFIENGRGEEVSWDIESRFVLTIEYDLWIATHTKIEDYAEIPFHYEKGTGTTPEEAVANLWLELNKKPTS